MGRALSWVVVQSQWCPTPLDALVCRSVGWLAVCHKKAGKIHFDSPIDIMYTLYCLYISCKKKMDVGHSKQSLHSLVSSTSKRKSNGMRKMRYTTTKFTKRERERESSERKT